MKNTSQDLKNEVLEMGKLVEDALRMSINTSIMFEKSYVQEGKINQYHTTIDNDCFEYIALKSPTATDLRITLACIRMNSELERCGDQCLSIKRFFKNLDSTPSSLASLIETTQANFHRALHSFEYSDVSFASRAIEEDKHINDLNNEILEHSLKLMQKEDLSFSEGFSIIRIAKSLERIGDMATNIAEAAVFVVSGTDIRHQTSKDKGRE